MQAGAGQVTHIPGTVAAFSRVWTGEPYAVATLDRMRSMVLDEYEIPSLVEIATDLAETVPEKDPAAITGAILHYLRERTRFVPDPVGSQDLKAPTYMLMQIAKDGRAGGDCADLAMLSAALCMAVGISCRFIAEGYEPAAPGKTARLVHVYTVAQVPESPAAPDGWVNLDTQRTPEEADTRPTYRVEQLLP